MDKKKALSLRAAAVPAAIVLFLGLVLFLTAGTFDYRPSWIYLGVFGGLTLGMVLYFSAKRPVLLERRAGWTGKLRLNVHLRLSTYFFWCMWFRDSTIGSPGRRSPSKQF